jgi:phosphoribosylamine---glycine ligase
MKILVIGSGAREHALAWKISRSHRVEKLFVAPGNGGTGEIAENVDISPGDVDGLLRFALANGIDMTVVGPEEPLVMGIVDRFRENGLRIVGPDMSGARLEGSKSFSKRFMNRYGIPTAGYAEVSSYQDALVELDRFKLPVVIKADGLAAGKGVIIARTRDEAVEALSDMMLVGKFGEAGSKVIIEEFLGGVEASIICLVDGVRMAAMPAVQDYKKAFDGDLGPNTGGMGAVCPSRIVTPELLARIDEEVLQRTMEGLKAEKMDYRGVIFIGLMIDGSDLNVLEYNVRFGDPETEVILPRMRSDILDVFDQVIDGRLGDRPIEWNDGGSACVMITSGGYPEAYESGKAISLEGHLGEGDESSFIFHAGTRLDEGRLVTSGGRVMCCTAVGRDVEDAVGKAYGLAAGISFEGAFLRRDIGR